MPELEIADQNFDLSFLLEIADGSNEFLVESIELFLQQAPELMQSIDKAIKAGEWTEATGFAHKLKPNLGFFGMTAAQTLMQEVEALCKTGGDPAVIRSKYQEIADIVNPTLVKLNHIHDVKLAEI